MNLKHLRSDHREELQKKHSLVQAKQDEVLEYKEKFIDARGEIMKIAAELQREKDQNEYLKSSSKRVKNSGSNYDFPKVVRTSTPGKSVPLST